MLILVYFEATFGPYDYNFSLVAFRVHISEVPIGWMNHETVICIIEVLGYTDAIDWNESHGSWMAYICILVHIDITNPLRHVTLLCSNDDRSKHYALVKDKRLATFCYKCSIIGHSVASCVVPKDPCNEKEEVFQYGDSTCKIYQWYSKPKESRGGIFFQKSIQVVRLQKIVMDPLQMAIRLLCM